MRIYARTLLRRLVHEVTITFFSINNKNIATRDVVALRLYAIRDERFIRARIPYRHRQESMLGSANRQTCVSLF